MSAIPQLQKGFTIVELLVVIVVIGILASITIVAYSGVQSSANAARKEADIANIKKIFERYRITDGNYPNSTSTALALPDISRFSGTMVATSSVFSCDPPGMTKEKYCLHSSVYSDGVGVYALWWWNDENEVWRYYVNYTNGGEQSQTLGNGSLPEPIFN